MTIVFCDTNKELCKKIKALNGDIKVFNKDVFKLKKQKEYEDYKIVTASNPSFSAGGGLDKSLKYAYPEQWGEAKEFNYTRDLFFVISVGDKFKTDEIIIKRCLAGVRAYQYKNLILTGIGTGIGGLNIDAFIDLFKKVIINADLRGADLSYTNLSDANLSDANLRCADLRCAKLSYTNLSDADLSDAKGLKYSTDYLKQFKHTKEGIIVYKAFGKTYHEPPNNWKIEENSVIEENVNWNLTDKCGCGINFATLEWIKREFSNEDVGVWECLIEYDDLPFVIIPFGTDGKARCQRLRLIRKLSKKELLKDE